MRLSQSNLISIYLLEVVADEDKVDTAEAQLGDAEEDVNQPPGSSRCPPQSGTLGGGKTCLRHVGVGEEGEGGPPTQLLRVVNCKEID